MASGVVRGGITKLLGWLRFKAGVEGDEDCWVVYVEEEIDPGLDGAWHHKFWCGAWIWGLGCRFGESCKYHHPKVNLQLCDGNPVYINKVEPATRVSLSRAATCAPERVLFVEHVHAGVIWTRMFSYMRNEQLLNSFLQGHPKWASTRCAHGRRAGFVCSAPILPDACWHRIVDFAGLRVLLKIQVALGSSFQWSSWLHQFVRATEQGGGSCEQRESEADIQIEKTSPERLRFERHTSEAPAPSASKQKCIDCLHWQTCNKCSWCKCPLCPQCQPPHFCQSRLSSARSTWRATEIDVETSAQTQHLGELVGAAAECATVANIVNKKSALARGIAHSMRAGRALESEIVRICAIEQPHLLQHRTLRCDANITSACYSESLLAVRTESHLRVFRRGDWKTINSSNLPCAFAQCDVRREALELIENHSLLVASCVGGLQILSMEAQRGFERLVLPFPDSPRRVQNAHCGLLVACINSVALLDLDQPALPGIETWHCRALGLTVSGGIAIVGSTAEVGPKENLRWLDPRQPHLEPLQISLDSIGLAGMNWTSAAIGVGSNASLAALAANTGELVAVDLRQPRIPLWCIRRPGVISQVQAIERMVFVRTSIGLPRYESALGTSATFANRGDTSILEAVSWSGKALAAFTGIGAIAAASSESNPLFACGVGSDVVIVGEAPAAVKETNFQGQIARQVASSRTKRRGRRDRDFRA